MNIGIPIYDKVDLLDVAAPREIFFGMKGYATDQQFDIWLLADGCADVTTRDGMTIRPQKTFCEVPELDLLWVPGGDPSALNTIINDPKQTFINYLVSSTKNAKWVTSV